MLEPRPRLLLRALAASLALHLVFFLGLSESIPPEWKTRNPGIRAVLRPSQLRPAELALSAPVLSESAKPLLTRRGPSKTEELLEAGGSAHRGQGDRAPREEAGASHEAVVPVPPALPAPQSGIDAEAVREYRMGVAMQARRYRHYPPLAKHQAWQGLVEVEVRLGGGIPLARVGLVRSSNIDVLDEEAVRMIERAVAATALPEALKGRDLRLIFPVRFGLDAAQ